MDHTETVRRFTGLLEPVLSENGLRLLKAEYVRESGNYYLRAYIERPDGEVSINDCTMVSRIISKKLDQEDFIPEAYTMEICSPGFLKPAGADTGEENNGDENIGEENNGGEEE